MDKEKNIKFMGYVLPRETTVGSPDGDIGVEQFIKTYNVKPESGCALCGVEHKTFFAFVSKVAGAEGNIGICDKCLGRLNTSELTVYNSGTNSIPTVFETTGKFGWVTEEEVTIGFEDFDDFGKNYRRSQKVWLDPALEPMRALNKSLGIFYLVEIGYQFKFYHLKDVWGFQHVKVRAHGTYQEFVETVSRGDTWNGGAITVRQVKE